MTALHLAVLACKPAIVETLLGNGASVDLKGNTRNHITKGFYMTC